MYHMGMVFASRVITRSLALLFRLQKTSSGSLWPENIVSRQQPCRNEEDIANNHKREKITDSTTRLDADSVRDLLVNGTLVVLGGEGAALELASELPHGGSLSRSK